jgi:hypothetical protein
VVVVLSLFWRAKKKRSNIMRDVAVVHQNIHQKIIIAEQKRSLSSPWGTKSCARTCCGEGVCASSLRRFA